MRPPTSHPLGAGVVPHLATTVTVRRLVLTAGLALAPWRPGWGSRCRPARPRAPPIRAGRSSCPVRHCRSRPRRALRRGRARRTSATAGSWSGSCRGPPKAGCRVRSATSGPSRQAGSAGRAASRRPHYRWRKARSPWSPPTSARWPRRRSPPTPLRCRATTRDLREDLVGRLGTRLAGVPVVPSVLERPCRPTSTNAQTAASRPRSCRLSVTAR